jgi:YD repeat-containing protein
MKKILNTILLIIFSAIIIKAQSFSENIDKERFKTNNVKSQVKWKYKHGSTSGTKILSRVIDKQGNIIEEINYKPNGDISSRLTFKYDALGNKIEFINTNVAEDNKISFKQSFIYDSKNRLSVENGYDGISNYRLEYKYGDNDKIIEIIKYNAANQIEEKWNYTYSGNLVTIQILKGGISLKSKIIEKYDAKNNLIEKITYNSDNTIQKRNVYKYDDNRHLIQEEEYYQKNLLQKLLYNYNSNGFLISIDKIEPDGKKYTNNRYEYDTKGNLIEELWYDGDPNDYSKKSYNYDLNNNLTQVDSYYSQYKYKVLYKYTYEFY